MRAKIIHIDVILLVVLLVLCNLHLLSNSSSDATAFFPARVFDGEWWRIVTHMFTHVSWYHLLIDASAFFLIYSCLAEQVWWRRLLYVAACSLGSLAGAFFSPLFYSLGLCGLSGAAHGLLAVVALELITGRNRPNRLIGWIVLVALVGKTGIELYTGQAFFSALHFGTIGTPIVQCHAGGIAGGALLFAFFALFNRLSQKNEYVSRQQ